MRSIINQGLGYGFAIALSLLPGWAAQAQGAAPDGAAAVSCPGGGVPGTITVTESLLEPRHASIAAELKSAQRCVLTKEADAEAWKVYLVAHLNRAPGAEEVNIVFYEQVPPVPGRVREPVQAYPIPIRRDAKVTLASLEIKPEDGFKVGHKYEIRLTRLINGREDVYARTTLELK